MNGNRKFYGISIIMVLMIVLCNNIFAEQIGEVVHFNSDNTEIIAEGKAYKYSNDSYEFVYDEINYPVVKQIVGSHIEEPSSLERIWHTNFEPHINNEFYNNIEPIIESDASEDYSVTIYSHLENNESVVDSLDIVQYGCLDCEYAFRSQVDEETLYQVYEDRYQDNGETFKATQENQFEPITYRGDYHEAHFENSRVFDDKTIDYLQIYSVNQDNLITKTTRVRFGENEEIDNFETADHTNTNSRDTYTITRVETPNRNIRISTTDVVLGKQIETVEKDYITKKINTFENQSTSVDSVDWVLVDSQKLKR